MILRSSMFPSSTGATKSTRSIVNPYSQAGWNSITVNSLTGWTISTLSGAMTTNTLKTILSISGVGGQVSLFTFRCNDATARTIRVKITVDGIVVCDSTSASISASGNGGFLAGTYSSSSSIILPPIFWKSTLLIEMASSLTETDKFTIEKIYNTEA